MELDCSTPEEKQDKAAYVWCHLASFRAQDFMWSFSHNIKVIPHDFQLQQPRRVQVLLPRNKSNMFGDLRSGPDCLTYAIACTCLELTVDPARKKEFLKVLQARPSAPCLLSNCAFKAVKDHLDVTKSYRRLLFTIFTLKVNTNFCAYNVSAVRRLGATREIRRDLLSQRAIHIACRDITSNFPTTAHFPRELPVISLLPLISLGNYR